MYLYGASGHAKVIIDILNACGIVIDGLVDDNKEQTDLLGYPVYHEVKDRSPFIISIGNNEIRKRIAERLKVKFGTAVHPSAIISSSVTIKEGTVVMQGAIVQSCTRIGKHCIINTGASVDHECIIDDFVHVSPHCTLCGNVHVGEGCWIGAGTTVIPGIQIGEKATVAAGSVVIKDVPANAVVAGVPAKVLRMKE